jgi:4-amino-4-deoxy-L-arabinose transferase-like glycosyltransferase
MDHKKSQLIDSGKKRAPGENKEWIIMITSSRWIILLILLLAGIVWYGFYITHTNEIAGSDDREYVSVARNIASGKGIVKNFVFPVDVNFFQKLPIPEFFHPPGYPLIVAGFFKLFGFSDFVALLPSYLSYFILLILLFYFVRRYLDIKTAVIAAVILIFNKEILDFSLTALSETVYTLIFFLFFILFVKTKTLRGVFVAGILLGVSQLVRNNIYPFLIPTLVYLYFYPDLSRWRKITFFMIGIFIPIILDWVRAFLETGSPLFSYGKFMLMSYSEKYPWLDVFRSIANPSLFEFLIDEPSQFIFKYVTNLVTIVGQVLPVSNLYLSAFFLSEMFYWKDNQDWSRIKTLFLSLFLCQILFISSVNFSTARFFIFFIPMMIFFAAKGFLRVSTHLISSAKMSWRKRILLVVFFSFFIFFMLPAIYNIFAPYKSPVFDFKTPQFGFLIQKQEAEKLNTFLRETLERNQVVWTDLPEILELEGDRLCGMLPTRVKTIYEIHKKIRVNAILLTSVRTPSRMEEEWKYLLFSEHSLPRYRTVKLYKGGAVFAKLLIRDEAE